MLSFNFLYLTALIQLSMSSNYKVTESEYFSKETEKNKVNPIILEKG